ncbi:hypothetical protein K461DRAFT_289583 [Myriangium duriaei CBS 260.36]|uniref:F-box domain-containing protein n=1 Tax=Myriangium duriaei CBS 260.36 TaxID=1168546 RepID=A0A9P4JDZ1_9PEZI|nr:hypothetical protein K461DRAFT_289583 [Myriangium duriaei CBS 260.36]
MEASQNRRDLTSLPTEIKLLITSHLGHASSEPPSGIPQIPRVLSNSGTRASSPLKTLSLVTQEWRTLLRPTILSHVLVPILPVADTGANSAATTRLRMALKSTAARLPSHLPSRISSLTIYIPTTFSPSSGAALRNSAQHTTDIITMHDFWASLFQRFDPLRLAIHAPPCVLGWLTTNVPATEDAWAFPSMNLQLLELTQPFHLPTQPKTEVSTETSAWDTQYLFCARPWSSVRLVEGSMMQAYGVYEYFHKRPPTVLGGLCLPRGETIKAFSDCVLFPFSTHVDQLQLACLSAYRSVHFHFSPAPNERVLDDPRVVGKADLSDCWREMEQIYKRAVSAQPLSPLFAPGAALREFSTGDYSVASIRELLDGEFAQHAAAGWRAVGEGRWVLTPEQEC